MKIKLNSIFVDDQDLALKFYTEVLGFVKKQDMPFGEYRWITVVSPDDPNGAELVLEPSDDPAVEDFRRALLKQGKPATAFQVDDIEKEFRRMKDLGVIFTKEPTKMGPVTQAVFDDICGNLIQIYQVL